MDNYIYKYSKLSKETLEDCMKECFLAPDTIEDKQFVLTVWGTKSSTEKWLKDFNKAIIECINDGNSKETATKRAAQSSSSCRY